VLGAYLAATAALRSRLLGAIAVMYAAQGNYRDEAAAAFVAQAVPAVQAAQQTMASLTSGYLAYLVSLAAGGSTRPVAVPASSLTAVRGVDPMEVYRRPYVQVWTNLAQGEAFPDAVVAGAQRAQSLAATDLQLAKTMASQTALRDDSRVTGYRRVLVGAQSCALCVLASTRWYSRGDLLPIHPGCVPDTALIKAFNISSATRRRYAGKLAIITTALGHQISVTPQHPIFTDRGWVSAGRVRPGDYMLNSGPSEGVVGGNPDESHRPVLAKDVWRSLAMTFGFVQVPLASEDFHGDGSNSEVSVIRADGYFSAVGDAEMLQTVGKHFFIDTQRWRQEFALTGVSAAFVPGGRPTPCSTVRSGSLSGPLLSGHFCRAHETGLRCATASDLSFSQPASDDAARHTPAMRDDVFCQAMDGVVGAELFRRVTDVSWVDFAGHVINFQTSTGRYESDSYIVHNCDCAVAPLFGHAQPDEIPTEQLHAIVARDLGDKYVSAGGTKGAALYRDIVVTHDHGELGQVLGVRGQHFTGPSDL
jgi:hypothetical protein